MSILNKVGLEKLSAYNDLLAMFNLQQAHILSLEGEILGLKDRMSQMSDTPRLRNELDYLNARYEKMKKDFKNGN